MKNRLNFYFILIFIFTIIFPSNVQALDFSNRIPYNSDGFGVSANIGRPMPAQYDYTNFDLSSYGNIDNIYFGGAWDGKHIWIIPMNGNYVLKINPESPENVVAAINITSYAPNGDKFLGAIFDGQYIWAVPYSSNYLLRINKDTNAVTTYNSSTYSLTSSGGFRGGLYDGENIWLIPFSTSRLVKVNKNTGALVSAYDISSYAPQAQKYMGGVFDGTYIWLVPFSPQNKLLKVHKNTGAITAYDISGHAGSNTFWGGVHDGEYIWLTSSAAGGTSLRINKSTGTITKLNLPVSNYGGTFDGQYVWFFTHGGPGATVDPGTGNIVRQYQLIAGASHHSIIFDGTNIWMLPGHNAILGKLSPKYTIEKKYLCTNCIFDIESDITYKKAHENHSDECNDINEYYKLIGYKINNGITQDGKYSFIDIEDDYEIACVYEKNPIVYEKFELENGRELIEKITTIVSTNSNYSKQCISIDEYENIGYRINNEDIVIDIPNIDNIVNDIAITCIYKETEYMEIINPKTGIADYLIPILSFFVTSILSIAYLRKKNIKNI